MSVLRQGNWQGQQRVDVVHLRAIESAVAGDFDLLAGTMIAGQTPEIVSGFYLLTTGITIATDLKIQVGGSTIIHFLASESGSIFSVPANRADEQLNSTNPRVIGSFTPSQVNYVGIDFIRQADASTTDLVEFIDTQSLQETPVSLPLGRTIDYRIRITTLDFDNNPGIAPIAKVTVDSTGNITAVVDARDIMFRLGSGGTVPDISHAFPWPAGRKENTIGDTFVGGDKAITSFKSWMDAIMTRLWEVGGGEYWYSPTNNSNEKLTRTGSPFVSNGEFMEWDGTNLHWQGLVWVFANSTGVTNVVNDQPTSSPGLTDLVDGECIYVDVDRTQNRSGGTALNAVKAPLATLGEPTVPGTRFVLAWRNGSSVYTRDQSYSVGSSFKLATDTASGMAKLSATTASLDNGSDPRVAAVDSTGLAYASGVTRGGGTIGNAVLFGALGAGTLFIGGSNNDTNVRVSALGGTLTLRADNGHVVMLSEDGDMDISTGGTGGDIGVTASGGSLALDASIDISATARAVIEKTQTNNYSLDGTANLTFTNNVNFVFVSGGNTHLSFIAIAPWGVGSRLYLRLGAGVIVNNSAGGPPGGSASILLSTANPQRGPTTNAGSMLELVYDGTNWVEPGVF